jgi:hypothetical protein
MARLNIAKSRARPSTCSLVRINQTCLGRRGGFAPVSFPLFQGAPLYRWDKSLLITHGHTPPLIRVDQHGGVAREAPVRKWAASKVATCMQPNLWAVDCSLTIYLILLNKVSSCCRGSARRWGEGARFSQPHGSTQTNFHLASGSGRSWKCTTLLVVPLPPSMW